MQVGCIRVTHSSYWTVPFCAPSTTSTTLNITGKESELTSSRKQNTSETAKLGIVALIKSRHEISVWYNSPVVVPLSVGIKLSTKETELTIAG